VWLSVDPLGEGKPWMTSYHYCSNNPVNRIDPDGRNDFGQDVKTGQMSLIKSTNDNHDRIILGNFNVDNEQPGSFQQKEDGRSLNSTFTPTNSENNSIVVSKGVFPEASAIEMSEKLTGERMDFSRIGLNFENAQEGISVMKFISFNIHKEVVGWGHKNDQLLSLFIVPWHRNKIDKAFPFIGFSRNNRISNIVFMLHTHPGSYEGDFGSDYYGFGNPSDKDYDFTDRYKNKINYYILSKYEGYSQFFHKSRKVTKGAIISF